MGPRRPLNLADIVATAFGTGGLLLLGLTLQLVANLQ